MHYFTAISTHQLLSPCHLPLLSWQRRILMLCLSTLCVLITTSCGNTQPVKTVESAPISAVAPKATVPELLDQAKRAKGNLRIQLLLRAANSLVHYKDMDHAQTTLAKLDPRRLNESEYVHYALLSAEIANTQGKRELTRKLLWSKRFTAALVNSSKANRAQTHEMRAEYLYAVTEYPLVIDERLQLETLLQDAPEQRDLNQDLIWQALMEQSPDELLAQSQSQNSRLQKGWYTLALASKSHQTNLREQLLQVESWRQKWPQHPANIRLPADLQLLQQLVTDSPKNIAVLLPFSGKFAPASNAIRDGLMAAFYQQRSQAGHTLPALRIYDSSNDDINQVYNQAVGQGAELVIGPLNKGKITQLAKRKELPVPTLALNAIESLTSTPQQMYQFGLAVEDEARQVAERAYLDGLRRALILAPKNAWGDRNVNAFSQQWQALGGSIIDDRRFSDQKQYSNLIKHMLDVDASERRAREIRRISGQKIEFEPRRRQDIDLIFLVARPSQARQLKPTLAFHYAGDIPVYATSHIYNGQSDTKTNRDMNAIRFATLPWFFDSKIAEKQAVDAYANTSANYQRLYALGVDAFHISPRLRQLARIENSRFYGATGTLSLDNLRKIKRQQTWAQFIHGQAQAVPTLTKDDDVEQNQDLRID